VQVVLLVSALLADAFALWAIAARITEFGFTPESGLAALGENVILLVNLAWVRRALHPPCEKEKDRSLASNGGRRRTCRCKRCGRQLL
jgi:hypothetical protein